MISPPLCFSDTAPVSISSRNSAVPSLALIVGSVGNFFLAVPGTVCVVSRCCFLLSCANCYLFCPAPGLFPCRWMFSQCSNTVWNISSECHFPFHFYVALRGLFKKPGCLFPALEHCTINSFVWVLLRSVGCSSFPSAFQTLFPPGDLMHLTVFLDELHEVPSEVRE